MKKVRWASIKPDGKYEQLLDNGRWEPVTRAVISAWMARGILIHFNPEDYA